MSAVARAALTRIACGRVRTPVGWQRRLRYADIERIARDACDALGWSYGIADADQADEATRIPRETPSDAQKVRSGPNARGETSRDL